MFACTSRKSILSLLRTQQNSLLTRSFATAQKASSQQFASRVLMVEPTHFFLNEETFADNKFMNKVQIDQKQSSQKAKDEFKKFSEAIQKADVDVVVYKQQTPDLPDSVFPNNWFSTHKDEDIPDGLFVIYPMRVPSREREKNPLIIKEQGSQYKHLIDVQRHYPDQALEGTGSLLFDTANKKIYCELSVRADETLLQEFLQQFNKLSKNPYKTVVWRSVDPQGNAVYHTNVVMAVLRQHVILCTESIRDQNERKTVMSEITDSKLNRQPKKIIDINYDEMLNMGGNMLMVTNKKGEDCIIMSDRALKGLRDHNKKEIEKHYKVISSDLHMIETIGGGSARCMVAELF